MSSCGSEGQPAPDAASTAPAGSSGTAVAVELTSNLSGFLQPGSTTTCLNGGARPCAALIRMQPNLDPNYINADPSSKKQPPDRVRWPLEPYAGQPGDKVPVECVYPNGQAVHAVDNSVTSTNWYKVIVTKNHIVNPAVLAEMSQPGSPVATINFAGHLAIEGWVSELWFEKLADGQPLPSC
jgi:hypothetical protein